MRILFWGTPEFACVPLRTLLGEGYEVVGVVTQPDKPQGRSRTLSAPPVKAIALQESIPVFQPSTPREPEFLEMLRVVQPDISVVVAYGHLLPDEVIALPRLGTLNIHASLLPELRGAAPIQAAIRDGLEETGVTIMRMVRELDAGPVIHQARTPIQDDETYGELQMRLAELGAMALIEALTLMSVGAATERPQDDSLATYAPKVTREMARIDWSRSGVEVARMIRAYDPKPAAYSSLGSADVKLFGASAVANSSEADPGTVILTSDTLVVACGEGAVSIADVQPSGKTRMRASEWSRGRGVREGDRFGD
jgi:methionyl-tRNA formyltransferase